MDIENCKIADLAILMTFRIDQFILIKMANLAKRDQTNTKRQSKGCRHKETYFEISWI